tara:strand:+ start:722 stop:1264 length:543 start_codon:yes stop_codon:yes gene_type:complete
MTTKLSKNGYKIIKRDYDSKIIKDVKDELTVKPYNSFNKSQMNSDAGKFSVFLESPKKLYLPRFYGLKKFGTPTLDQMEEGDDINLSFNGDLREEQKPIEEIYLKNAHEKGGGIISIRCGGGKTVLALHIISVLKKKTVVIVHKDFLMTQWRDRILEFLPLQELEKYNKIQLILKTKILF